MDNTEEFRCLSLCTGYAGIEMGLKRAVPTLRTVAYVEIEAFAAANLVAKIEAGKLDAAPVWTDIKTFDARPFRKRVHIITAGYPCQPFSLAGKRQGTDDPRHLWPDIERIVQAVRPVWCFFENVPGHLTIGFPEVYRSLRLMGYKVEAGLFTAAEVGAPHRRERLFILANCDNKQGRIYTEGWDNKVKTRSGSKELADTECTGQGSGIIKKTQAGIGRNRPAIESWPARPGQPQCEWEEPRVVGNSLQRNSRTGKLGRARQSVNERLECNSKKTKFKLGGTTYGASSRVDRLRLLGNGVVPQQAELAFRELIKKF